MSTSKLIKKQNPIKFIVGGVLIVIAVVLIIISATKNVAEFYLTIEELFDSTDQYTGKNLRVSGAVIGESILYNSDTELLHFTIAHIPADDALKQEGDLERALHDAVNNPTAIRMDVIYDGPKPEMLRNESQAILTGTLREDGVFVAEELLLKCPSKYEEATPKYD
jgi:cytochrome c-type biogenesis protein CcmE